MVANALGIKVDYIERKLLPVITDQEIDLPGKFIISKSESAGVNQTYTGFVDGKPWFVAHFFGHVELDQVDRESGFLVITWNNKCNVVVNLCQFSQIDLRMEK